MKIARILILICTLFLFLCGCRDYETADLEVDCSPVPFSLNKEELANPPQDPKEQEYSHLNQPLHLIPRELFTTPNGIWTEYIQPEGVGVYYLYSYDAGESVNTYVVYLDIVARTLLPTHGFTAEVGAVYTFYAAQQRLQISPGFIGAVKWDKTTDTLSIWENPPFQPTVQISEITVSKGTEDVGTVLTDWLYSGTVSDPQYQDDHIPGVNVISRIIRRLTVGRPHHALNNVLYGVILNPEENGAFAEWNTVDYSHLIDYESECQRGSASFHNNHLAQDRLYGDIGFGSVSVLPNGKLTDTAQRMFFECNFSGLDQTFAKQLDWRIGVTLSLEK